MAALQASLESINKRLDTLGSKANVDQMREEVKELTQEDRKDGGSVVRHGDNDRQI